MKIKPQEPRVRCNLTLDPDFVAAVRKAGWTLSRFVEAAGWEYLNNAPKRDRRKSKEAKP